MNYGSVYAPLPKSFYDRDPITVARDLLGKTLLRTLHGVQIGGIIVETEAYLGPIDEASHSFRGKSGRNTVLFGDPGVAYVHSIHRYHCVDIVTEGVGQPTSVLIRALEPLYGIESMMARRGIRDVRSLTNGPGKLCRALHITRVLNGIDVTDPRSPLVVLYPEKSMDPFQIAKSARVGLSKATDLELRFMIRKSPYLSGKKKK